MPNKIEFETLQKAAEPLLQLLKQYGDYYTEIRVTIGRITILQEMQGLPLEIID